MRYLTKGLIRTMVLVGSLFLISCATTQQAQQKEGISIAEAGNYSVRIPSGKHWQVNIDREKETVQFVEDRAIDRIITVSRQILGESKWSMSEESVADSVAEHYTGTVDNIVRKSEDRSAIAKFLTGRVELEFAKKGVEVIDGKRLHTMHYRLLSGGDALFRTTGIERKHFIYFQPDFANTHTFYMFSLLKIYPRMPLTSELHALGREDIMIIHDIINSLQYK